MSDSDFDLGQLEVDLTQLGGDEAEDLSDEVFAEEEQERFEDITNSFSKVSVTNWVKSGHQWETSDHQDNPFRSVGGPAPGFMMPGPTSYAASEAYGGGGVIGGARGSLARSSFSSLGSGGAGVVQSPPGYDSYGSQSSVAPPQGYYQELRQELPMGSGNGGLVTNGRATPASFAGQISAPQHFKFPPEGTSQIAKNPNSLAARGLLPSQRLGLTPSPVPLGGGHRGLRPPRPQYNFCVFCKNNGEDEKFYMTHTLKDDGGLVRCPVLMKYTCPICGATGKVAHTVRYCPKNKDDKYHENFAPITLLKGMRSSTGKARVADSVESWMKPPTESSAAAAGSICNDHGYDEDDHPHSAVGYRSSMMGHGHTLVRPVFGHHLQQNGTAGGYHPQSGLRNFANTPPPTHYRY